MKTLFRFMASPAVGQAGINILKTILALLLAWASAVFPVAGWHRLFLKIPGWYWWPVGGFLALFGIFTSYLFHQQAWLIMAAPIPLLLSADFILIVSAIWGSQR
ncbi:MAG TPA: hypothetical protein VGK14_04415 [Novimethylophilus sp.]|jgi:hypothetical protein|uniref:hypothetical protein n=1 Tax=Novimethylophilus sp. TaxID=2137426 RepID=UPI002F40B8F1